MGVQFVDMKLLWPKTIHQYPLSRRSVGDLDEPFGRLEASPEEKEVAELLDSLPPHHLKDSCRHFLLVGLLFSTRILLAELAELNDVTWSMFVKYISELLLQYKHIS